MGLGDEAEGVGLGPLGLRPNREDRKASSGPQEKATTVHRRVSRANSLHPFGVNAPGGS